MAKKKQTDFSPYNRPWAPRKPLKIINTIVELDRITTGSYDSISPEDMKSKIEGATSISVEVEEDPYGQGSHSVILRFIKYESKPNPNYKSQLENYKKEMREYRERLKVWNEQKAEWDIDQAEKTLKYKKNMLEKLKKELGEI